MAEAPADETNADSEGGSTRAWWHPTPTAWLLGTFNVVTLGLALVVLAHRADALGVLQELGTLPGVLVFGYLWALTVLVTERLLVDGGRSRLDGGLGSFALYAILAGALIGMAFLTGLVVGAGATAVAVSTDLTDPTQVAGVLLSAFSVSLFMMIALPIASVVGGILGGLLGVVDLLLYRVAGMVVTTETTGQ